jgi:RND family efflux transporter MFP subunit
MSGITKKSIILIILILLSGVGVFMGLSMLKNPPQKKSGDLLRSLRVLPLKKESVTPKIAEFAVVRSLEEVSLRTQVMGKVVFCGDGTEDGVKVKKGDIIIEIEKNDYEIARQQAEAELDILKAEAGKTAKTVKDITEMLVVMKEDYELEKIHYNRSKKLFDSKVYSRSEVERAQQTMSRRKKLYIEMSNLRSKNTFALESIKAQTKKAQALLNKAQLGIKRASVKAPIDGRICKCNVEIGEYVVIGQEICTITNDKKPSLKVSVDASEASDILRVTPGEKYWLNVPDDVKVTIAWVKKPEICKWDGQVDRIENYDTNTDTLRIMVTPTAYSGNRDYSFPLLPGMFCKVTFFGKSIENAFRIPFSALQFNNNVFTVNKEGVLSRHKIKPFSVEGDEVIILSGLPVNEQVVIQQLPRGLVQGMKVKPMLPRGGKKVH